ncbi:MAG: hypothetical protein MJ156_01370 [Alphaproteobacteria bacterium]|nr:hypothetical protein [Alphaproteobacteria bacterium]
MTCIVKHPTLIYRPCSLSYTTSDVNVYLPEETRLSHNNKQSSTISSRKAVITNKKTVKVIWLNKKHTQFEVISETPSKPRIQKGKKHVKLLKVSVEYNLFAHKHPKKELTKQLNRRRLRKQILQSTYFENIASR